MRPDVVVVVDDPVAEMPSLLAHQIMEWYRETHPEARTLRFVRFHLLPVE